MSDQHDAAQSGRVEAHRLSHDERIHARENFYTQLGSIGVALLPLVVTLVIPEGPTWTALPGCLYILLSPIYWIAGR